MAGRPRKYETVEEMEEVIEEYFDKCDESKRPYTVTGLAIALDMSRQDLINYCDRTDENNQPFFDTIKRAKNRVENSVEEGLLSGKYNATGAIFNLKNNYGWKDKQEQEITGANGDKFELNIKVIKD